MEAIVWLMILAVLIIIEIATLGLTTIWFAGGALIAFLASVVGAPMWLQITLFIVISIVLLVFTRPAAARFMNKDVQKTNVDSLIGKNAIVTQDIDNLAEKGQVVINGLEWTARSTVEGHKISKDTVVNIIEVQGVKLMVEEEK